MEIDIKVSDKAFKGNIREVLTIQEAILTDEFIRQPSTYAWFATLAEMASAEVENKKIALAVMKANLDGIKRKELELEVKKNDPKGKVTEAMVEAAILQDKKYQVSQDELIDTGRQLGILKAMVKALEQRKDMLIQLGSTKRQEMVLHDFGIDLNKVRERHQP